jgi:hypothetical protein
MAGSLGTGCAGLPALSNEPPGSDVEDGTPTPTPEATPSPTPSSQPEARPVVEGFDVAFDADDHSLAALVRVGSGENLDGDSGTLPHNLVVWNDDVVTRSLGITVESADRTRYDSTLEVPAGRYVRVELLEPADYRVVVTVEGRAWIDRVPARQFDCNASATVLRANADGEVAASTRSTTVACVSHRDV